MASPPRRRAGAGGWGGYGDAQQARNAMAARMQPALEDAIAIAKTEG
jgi:hypothetical protein